MCPFTLDRDPSSVRACGAAARVMSLMKSHEDVCGIFYSKFFRIETARAERTEKSTHVSTRATSRAARAGRWSGPPRGAWRTYTHTHRDKQDTGTGMYLH